jgi:hypothetical protein
MKAFKLSIAAAICAIVGAGCASTPKEIPELDAARAEVQQARAATRWLKRLRACG